MSLMVLLWSCIQQVLQTAFPSFCRYTEASQQTLECSALTITLKWWVSVCDIYWELIGEVTVGFDLLASFFFLNYSSVE